MHTPRPLSGFDFLRLFPSGHSTLRGQLAVRRSQAWMRSVGSVALALCSVCAMTGCGGPEPGPQEREAAIWALQNGGTVNVDATTVPVTSPERLPEAAFFVQRIDLHKQTLKDAELQNLVGLESVRELNLYATGIGDPALDHLAGLTSLRQLELSLTNITDAGLEKLVRLDRLQKLFVRGTNVTDEGVENLEKRLTGCTIYQ